MLSPVRSRRLCRREVFPHAVLADGARDFSHMRGVGVSHNQRVGRWGEQQACDYLAQRGYEILARNVRTPYGEIDVLAQREGFIVFVEVKARLSGAAGRPEMSVTPRKQGRMAASAAFYAQQHGIEHWQIDVIAIERVAGAAQIMHFENTIS